MHLRTVSHRYRPRDDPELGFVSLTNPREGTLCRTGPSEYNEFVKPAVVSTNLTRPAAELTANLRVGGTSSQAKGFRKNSGDTGLGTNRGRS